VIEAVVAALVPVGADGVSVDAVLALELVVVESAGLAPFAVQA
jgi:hypothetical protein